VYAQEIRARGALEQFPEYENSGAPAPSKTVRAALCDLQVYAQQHYGGRVVPVACVKLSADAMLLHCPGSVSVAETECHGGAANDRKDGGDGMASERLRSNGWLDTAATVARLELKSMDPVIASIVPDLDDGE